MLRIKIAKAFQPQILLSIYFVICSLLVFVANGSLWWEVGIIEQQVPKNWDGKKDRKIENQK